MDIFTRTVNIVYQCVQIHVYTVIRYIHWDIYIYIERGRLDVYILHMHIPTCQTDTRVSTYIHVLGYITLRCHTSHYNASHYIALHLITLHYRIKPYRTIPYHTMAYHTVPYHTMPYCTILYAHNSHYLICLQRSSARSSEHASNMASHVSQAFTGLHDITLHYIT